MSRRPLVMLCVVVMATIASFVGCDREDNDWSLYDPEAKQMVVDVPDTIQVSESSATGVVVRVTLIEAPSDTVYVVPFAEEDQLVFDPDSLSFVNTPGTDWDNENSATFVIKALQDEIFEGDHEDLVEIIANSRDDAYDGQSRDEPVLVQITDDDDVGILFDAEGLIIREDESDTYTVSLASQPVADVTVAISQSIQGEGTEDDRVTVDPQVLTFTAANWAQSQTVTVSVDADDIGNQDNELVDLIHTASSADEGYDGATSTLVLTVVPTQTAVLASLDFAEGSPQYLQEADLDAFVTLEARLSSQSDTPVTVVIGNTGNAHCVAGQDYEDVAHELVFEPGDLTKSFNVAALQDTEVESTEQFVVQIVSVDGADVSDQTLVTIPIEDDDSATIALSTVPVEEGSPIIVTASLSGDFSENITIDYAIDPSTTQAPATEGADYFDPGDGTLTFQPGGTTTQTVTIATIDDDDADAAPTEYVTFSVTGTSGNVEVNPQSIECGILDNDSAGVLVSPVALSIPEGGSNTYGIQLMTAPTNDVTVLVAPDPSDSRVSFSQDSLVFTTGNWNQQQSFTVIVADDGIPGQANDEVLLQHSLTSADTNYDGLAIDSVVLTIIDTSDDPVVNLALASGSPENLDEGNQGANVVWRVYLDRESESEVTVDFSTIDSGGCARGDDFDYDAADETVEFAPGNTEATVSIWVVQDPLVEGLEGFSVSLSSADGADLGSVTSGSVGIVDNDQAEIAFSPPAPSATEGTTMNIRVTTPTGIRTNVPFSYTTTLLSQPDAASADDFTGISGVGTLSESTPYFDLTISIAEDALLEEDEVFLLEVDASNESPVDPANVTCTIVDGNTAEYDVDDSGAIATENVDENVSFVLDIGTAPAGTETYYVTTLDGDGLGGAAATAGSDYQGYADQAVVFNNTATVAFDVPVLNPDDGAENATEYFRVQLLDGPGGNVLATGVGAIIDGQQPYIRIQNTEALEEEGVSNFTAELVDGSGTPVTSEASEISFVVTTSHISTEADDFDALVSVSVTIDGATGSGVIPVTIHEDNVVEDDEIFILSISELSIVNAAGLFAGYETPRHTILNDDTTAWSIEAVSLPAEVEEGSSFQYRVELTNPVEGGASCTVVAEPTGSDPASIGPLVTDDLRDYSQNVTLAAPDTEDTFSVPTNDDDQPEALREQFLLRLTSSDPFADETLTVEIIDNDQPRLEVLSATQTEGEGSASVTVRLVDSGGSPTTAEGDVSFRFNAVTDGGDAADTDFTDPNSLETIAAGNLSVVVLVPITDDGIDEDSETFSVELSDFDNAAGQYGDGVGVVTIEDDDTAGLTLGITSATINEDDGSLIFAIQREDPAERDISFTLTPQYTADEADADDIGSIGPLPFVIEADSTQAAIVVPITSDGLAEAETQYLDIVLTRSDGGGITDDTIRVTIEDADQPCIHLTGLTVDEGDAGDTILTVTAQLQDDEGAAVTVHEAPVSFVVTAEETTLGDDANIGNPAADLPTFSSLVTITVSDAGSTTFDVIIFGDTDVEPDEFFELRLGTLTNTTGACTGPYYVTIQNDD